MSSRVKEDIQRLFEFWCEVTKSEQSNVLKQAGHIIESFPEGFKDDQIIGKIPEFAYPCEFENESVQTYSFVLTSDDSKWRFGFCRHDPKTQTAMVIITYLPWHDTFLRYLGVLGELRRKNNGEFESFLAETYSKGIPEPGGNLKLFYNSGENNFVFQRPLQFQLPSIPENHNLNLYYNFVDAKQMISVFAAMLSERRIIFTSRRLDRLSSCIQAANAFLYPMVWQHIFIPVLPMKLKDILSAPMPYLIGVPEAVLETMTPDELGEVVILNCDKKTLETPFEDAQEMPTDIVHQMKKGLSNSNDHIGDRVSRIFLIALVHLIGNYRDAIRFPYGKKIQFDQEAFIESKPPHLRPFLTRMMDLQIFQQFIDDRILMFNNGKGLSEEFEIETLRQAEKMNKRSRNYKEFLRNVKDKTNPAVKSAVKSVKEGGRGVKTAYKDLKSKFRDDTPSKSQFHVQSNFASNSFGATSLPHSAPNSPVISRRQCNDYSLSNNHGGTLPVCGSNITGSNEIHYLTTSSSCIQNGFSSEQSSINSNLFLGSSPAISPSSSVCSSDMNLTQELQNHPLFKSPAVDRSLKPSNSLDSGRLNPTRYNGISAKQLTTLKTNSPIHLTNSNCTADSSNRTFYSRSQAAHKDLKKIAEQSDIYNSCESIIEVPMGNICIVDLDEEKEKNDVFAIVTTKSIFDVAPDMPSPPVPPRRNNNKSQRNQPENNLIDVDKSVNFINHNLEKPLKNPFDNNFDVNCINHSKEPSSVSKINETNTDEGKIIDIFQTHSTTPCRSSRNAHVNNKIQHFEEQRQPQQIIFNDLLEIPQPVPRQKFQKEHSNSSLTTTKVDQNAFDLINLDDGNSSSNNTSFEIEDFDPLNQNAKPIPSMKTSSPAKLSSNIILDNQSLNRSSPIPIVNNQIGTNISSFSTLQNYSQLSNNITNLSNNGIAGCTMYPMNNTSKLSYFAPQFNGRNYQQNSNNSNINPQLNLIGNNNKNDSDDDVELLRKYGLDQFTLTSNGKMSINDIKDNICNGKDEKSGKNGALIKPINNWTVFD